MTDPTDYACQSNQLSCKVLRDEIERLREQSAAQARVGIGQEQTILDLRAELDEHASHGPEGRNVTNAQYVALRAERDLATTRIASLHASLDAVQAECGALRADAETPVMVAASGYDGMAARLATAEARVAELEKELTLLLKIANAIGAGSFKVGYKGVISALHSAGAVQEPACQHDLQRPEPTVRVWHSMFEPEKQSAECNVCGSRWTIRGVGRG